MFHMFSTISFPYKKDREEKKNLVHEKEQQYFREVGHQNGERSGLWGVG